jgi:hypothetical protein
LALTGNPRREKRFKESEALLRTCLQCCRVLHETEVKAVEAAKAKMIRPDERLPSVQYIGTYGDLSVFLTFE